MVSTRERTPGHRFRIYGDNIVECERLFALILEALDVMDQDVSGPHASAACPHFLVDSKDLGLIEFAFFPGFGRWTQDILGFIRDRGGKLREIADVILTKVVDGVREDPLLAIEYSGALPAGNQAWQRNGRAYSFAHAEVPFLYVAELGGFELGSDRIRKAPRLPNPAVPFSYLTLSTDLELPSLPVFLRSPDATDEAIKRFKDVFGDAPLRALVKQLVVHGEAEDSTFDALKVRALRLVQDLASNRGRKDSLTAAQWQEALIRTEQGRSLTEYLKDEAPLPWSKTAYIESLTDTFRQLLARVGQYSIGLTATNLPISIVPSEAANQFAKDLKSLYPELPTEFSSWLAEGDDITVCWVMGFKPRGDDARPDRGLPPLARMLVGDEAKVLTVVYGPAKSNTWDHLTNSPVELARRNGLWESILAVSDGVLIDSKTLPVANCRAFLRPHWKELDEQLPLDATLPLSPARPNTIGEHDVDTVLHLLFARLAGSASFEGMCNPPGGDWSGVSVLSEDRCTEFRWLNLPRVTATGSKRPDHVFHLFSPDKLPILLIIESKELARHVEIGIGPQLKSYLASLFSHAPSVARNHRSNWTQHTGGAVDSHYLRMASAAAFVFDSVFDPTVLATTSGADLLMAVEFRPDESGVASIVHVYPVTDIGTEVVDFMLTHLPTPTNQALLSFNVHQIGIGRGIKQESALV